MATDEGEQVGDGEAEYSAEAKAGKPRPIKSLPTDRVSFENQLLILRAFAKASLAVDKAAVSNSEVARYAGVAPSSISNCNAFWNDAGLLVREGYKLRPVQAIFDFDQASEWSADQAGGRLASVLGASWFGKAMLTKLAIKPTTIPEALQFLAQECRASIDYKDQIKLLLDYLEVAGLVVLDGSNVSKAATRTVEELPVVDKAVQGGGAISQMELVRQEQNPPEGVKRFSIPIPDKVDAVIVLPDDLDSDDWEMVKTFLNTYVQRWKKFPTRSVASGGQSGLQTGGSQ